MSEQMTQSPGEFDVAMDNVEVWLKALSRIRRVVGDRAAHLNRTRPRNRADEARESTDGEQPQAEHVDVEREDAEGDLSGADAEVRTDLPWQVEHDDQGAPLSGYEDFSTTRLMVRAMEDGSGTGTAGRLSDADIEQLEQRGFTPTESWASQARTWMREHAGEKPSVDAAFVDEMRLMAVAIFDEDEISDQDLDTAVDEYGFRAPIVEDYVPGSMAADARARLAEMWGLTDPADSAVLEQRMETIRVMKEAIAYEPWIGEDDQAVLRDQYGFTLDGPEGSLHDQAQAYLLGAFSQEIGRTRPEEAFDSEIRIPFEVSAVDLAAAGVALEGEGALGRRQEEVQAFLRELGAEWNGQELQIPVAGAGGDADARLDPRVEAWRDLTVQDVVAATFQDGMPMDIAFLQHARGADPAVELDVEGTRLRVTAGEGGLMLERAAFREGLSPDEQAGAVRYYEGTWDEDRQLAWFPVSSDPHQDLRVIAAAQTDPVAEELRGSGLARYEASPLGHLRTVAQSEGTVEEQMDSLTGGLDLATHHRADGTPEAMIWVDQDGVAQDNETFPSVWLREDGTVDSFGAYEDGRPTGEWGWADATGSWATERGTFTNGELGSFETRESLESGWTSVDPAPSLPWRPPAPSGGPSPTAAPTGPAPSGPSASGPRMS